MPGNLLAYPKDKDQQHDPKLSSIAGNRDGNSIEDRPERRAIKGFHSFHHTFSYGAEQMGVPPSTIKR